MNNEPKVGESGLGDEQFVKQKYPNATARCHFYEEATRNVRCFVIQHPQPGSEKDCVQLLSNGWDSSEDAAWADARARIEAASPVEKVAPQGGEEETCRYCGNLESLCECGEGGFASKSVKAGEWVQPITEGYRMTCCDCNLSHLLDFRIYKGKVQFRAFREYVAPPSLPEQGFEEWFNSNFTESYSGTYHRSRGTKEDCRAAWNAARGGR